MSGNDPTHGIDLAEHARISALIAEGTRPSTEVLEERRLTDTQWNEATIHWMSQLAEDARINGAQSRLAITYSEAFAQAQNSLAAVPPMTPEDWATLTVEVQNEGSSTLPLARRNLSFSDYLRLVRHFAKRLSSDPAEQQRFFARYLALQPAQEPDV